MACNKSPRGADHDSHSNPSLRPCTPQHTLGCGATLTSGSACGQQSIASWASAPARCTKCRCFLSRTSFLTPHGDRLTAAELKASGGDIVLGPNRVEVRVLRSVRCQPPVERDIVYLHTEGNSYPFQVTADHRLFVSHHPSHQPRICSAQSMVANAGPHYIYNGSISPLKVVKAELKREKAEIVQVTFEDDLPVLAWVLPKRARAGSARPPLRNEAGVACLGARLRPEDVRIPVSSTFVHFKKSGHTVRSRSVPAWL